MFSINLASLRSVMGAVGEKEKLREAEVEEVEELCEDEEELCEAEETRLDFCPVIEEGCCVEALVRRARVTAEEARTIEGYEQGTKAWHLSRRGTQTRMSSTGLLYSETEESKGEPFMPGRLTASNFGSAVGHNKYSSPDDLVRDMLWGTVVSNEAMAYGSKMEPVACRVFELAMMFITGGRSSVEHRGLMLACPALYDEDEAGGTYEGWAGTSPDGIVNFDSQEEGDESRLPSRSLLEIKCPSVNRRTFYSERRDNARFKIPHYYYDQIMGICGLQQLDDAFFVVHLPDRTQIMRYLFDRDYWAELSAGLRSFWFENYLPAAVHCARGELVRGEVSVRFKRVTLREEDVALAKQEAIDILHSDSLQ